MPTNFDIVADLLVKTLNEHPYYGSFHWKRAQRADGQDSNIEVIKGNDRDIRLAILPFKNRYRLMGIYPVFLTHSGWLHLPNDLPAGLKEPDVMVSISRTPESAVETLVRRFMPDYLACYNLAMRQLYELQHCKNVREEAMSRLVHAALGEKAMTQDSVHMRGSDGAFGDFHVQHDGSRVNVILNNVTVNQAVNIACATREPGPVLLAVFPGEARLLKRLLETAKPLLEDERQAITSLGMRLGDAVRESAEDQREQRERKYKS